MTGFRKSHSHRHVHHVLWLHRLVGLVASFVS